ncbi:MAG TPA: PQQ-dependent sugar dehydrogenase [Conexibacter sp.]|nr:PQQ-dependent sugar dehydrogenase [Conexibacter sp.]
MPRPAAILALAVALMALAAAAAGASGVRLVRVGTFSQPDYVAAPRGDAHRLFVVQRDGLIRLVRDGRVLRAPFADLRAQVLDPKPRARGDRRGLLSVAFTTDYARTGLLYAMYVDKADRLRVDELRRSAGDPNRADPASRRLVIELGPAARRDVGGQLQWGPGAALWISTGDEGAPASAQDLGSLNGKLLLINPATGSGGRGYGIPHGNPFVRRAAARPEIFAYGLRDPWRFSLDSPQLFTLGDVGAQVQEVDATSRALLRGASFGWPQVEGDVRRGPGHRGVLPLIVHPRGAGWCAVVGGYRVRDRSLPALYGRYVYGDMCQSRLWAARLTVNRAIGDGPLPLRVRSLVSFGLDGLNRLYAVSLAGGVWRFAAA